LFSVTQDIIWGDMDAYNHINNTVYFRYFENVRIVYFEQVGINKYMSENQIGPILGETSCRYLKPLTYPDTITISTNVPTLRAKRFTMNYEIYSNNHKAVVATGMGEIVFVDYRNGKTIEIPEIVRNEIIQVEGDSLELI